VYKHCVPWDQVVPESKRTRSRGVGSYDRDQISFPNTLLTCVYTNKECAAKTALSDEKRRGVTFLYLSSRRKADEHGNNACHCHLSCDRVADKSDWISHTIHMRGPAGTSASTPGISFTVHEFSPTACSAY
jgi:hypothetical protein